MQLNRLFYILAKPLHIPRSGGVQLSWGVTASRARLVLDVFYVPDKLSYGAEASLFEERGDVGPQKLVN